MNRNMQWLKEGLQNLATTPQIEEVTYLFEFHADERALGYGTCFSTLRPSELNEK